MDAAPKKFEPYLTPEQACAALEGYGIRITCRTLAEKSRAKRVRSHKPNGRICYRLTELLEDFETEGSGARLKPLRTPKKTVKLAAAENQRTR